MPARDCLALAAEEGTHWHFPSALVLPFCVGKCQLVPAASAVKPHPLFCNIERQWGLYATTPAATTTTTTIYFEYRGLFENAFDMIGP